MGLGKWPPPSPPQTRDITHHQDPRGDRERRLAHGDRVADFWAALNSPHIMAVQ